MLSAPSNSTRVLCACAGSPAALWLPRIRPPQNPPMPVRQQSHASYRHSALAAGQQPSTLIESTTIVCARLESIVCATSLQLSCSDSACTSLSLQHRIEEYLNLPAQRNGMASVSMLALLALALVAAAPCVQGQALLASEISSTTLPHDSLLHFSGWASASCFDI